MIRMEEEEVVESGEEEGKGQRSKRIEITNQKEEEESEFVEEEVLDEEDNTQKQSIKVSMKESIKSEEDYI